MVLRPRQIVHKVAPHYGVAASAVIAAATTAASAAQAAAQRRQQANAAQSQKQGLGGVPGQAHANVASGIMSQMGNNPDAQALLKQALGQVSAPTAQAANQVQPIPQGASLQDILGKNPYDPTVAQ